MHYAWSTSTHNPEQISFWAINFFIFFMFQEVIDFLTVQKRGLVVSASGSLNENIESFSNSSFKYHTKKTLVLVGCFATPSDPCKVRV